MKQNLATVDLGEFPIFFVRSIQILKEAADAGQKLSTCLHPLYRRFQFLGCGVVEVSATPNVLGTATAPSSSAAPMAVNTP